MKVDSFNNQKKTYVLPMLEVVLLDNEISLTLASDLEPPFEPEWTYMPKSDPLLFV